VAHGATWRDVAPTELLDTYEQRWRELLKVVSLAAEALDSVEITQRERALKVLGGNCLQTRATERVALLRHWPAVHVLVTSGLAADHYESGTFWPALASQLDRELDQAFQRDWGTAFLANLRALGLPTFDDDSDAGTRYVGRILMHCGVPTYCLSDYYRLVLERRSRVAGINPEELVSWAGTRAAQDQLYGIDKPVARFLRYGGDFAVDVTDRVFDLLDAVAAGGSGADVALPERFRQVALRMSADGRLIPTQRSSNRSAIDTDIRPRLVVDPFGQGPLLRLPPVGDAPDGSAVWLVELDGAMTRVQTQAVLPGLNEPAPQTNVPLPGPVRSASVALQNRQHLQTMLTVIDDKQPLLAFGDDFIAIPPSVPLPGRHTWLLFPGERENIHISGNASVVTESPLPPGWSGWSLTLVDLSGATAVSFAGKSRPVRHQAAARILTDEPVPGVRTTAGLPVFASVPTISLPPELGGARWEVSLLDATGTTTRQWRSGDGGDPTSLWSSVPRPMLGTFTIRVRGPWGRGATRTVTVVEGLRVTFDPPWRRFVRAGLQRCEARVAVHPGMTVSRDVLQYAERDRGAHVRAGVGLDGCTLVVTPPHMTVAYQTAKMTSPPSVRPAKLFSEEVIDDPGTLIVDLGGAAEPLVHVRVPSGSIQVIPPSVGRAGMFQFQLSKIVDTLRSHSRVQLALDAAGSVEVATVSPRRLFTDARLVGKGIELTDCVDAEGLTAFVYPTRAPWRDPAVLPVAQGMVNLPLTLVNAGPLWIRVRIEDPWAPLPVPGWSDSGPSILLDGDGHVRGETDEESSISAYLSGEGALPDTITDLTRLWTARGLLDKLALGPRLATVAKDLDRALHADPRAALLSLSGSEVPSHAIPYLLITAGLAWANLESAHDDVPPSWSKRSALPAALLSAADAEWSNEEVHAATDVCGDIVSALLAGDDPCPSAGRLDEAAERFDSNPAIRDEFVRQTGLVPKGLLSEDSRCLAAMEFVKHRRDARLAALIRQSETIFFQAQYIVSKLSDQRAVRAFDARRHRTRRRGWQVVPAISLGFAFAARHAARGNQTATDWLIQHSSAWADLAIVVPSMVTIDIILAELLVASSQAPMSPERASQ
jgi:hypothetical protein